MTTEVLMPLMGEGITEATLVKWLKKPGDAVKKEEPLLEVSTDKVDTEIPSPAAGVLLETFAKDGDTVPINMVIAHLAAAGEEKAAPQDRGGATAGAGGAQKNPGPAPAKAPPPPAPLVHAPRPAGASASASAAPLETRRSSPVVRKMAKAEGIDLGAVPGSGLFGRITKRDMEAFQSGGTERAAPAAHAPLPPEKLKTKSDGGKEFLEGVPVRREKMTKMRALIAEHMIRSVKTSPHVTTVFEIDMHKVVSAREKNKKTFQAREGFALTYTPFFLEAAVKAIKKFPVVNVSVDGEDILWKDQINLGVAVAIETGLIVPVIKDAGELSLTGLARRLNDLATRARTKKLVPDDVQGGTFSVTNPGMFGSIVSAPIINQPQVAILSIGAIIKRPVVLSAGTDDLIGIRPLVQVGLTFDHRVVDGEGGARWLAAFKEALETFGGGDL